MKDIKTLLNEAKTLMRIKDIKGKTVTNGYYITSKGKSIEVTNWKAGKLIIKDGSKTLTFTDPTDDKLKPYADMKINSTFKYNNGKDVKVGDTFIQYGHSFVIDKIDPTKDLIHTSQVFKSQKSIQLRGVTSKRFNGGDIVKAKVVL